MKNAYLTTAVAAILAAGALASAEASAAAARTPAATTAVVAVSASDLEALRAEFTALRERLERLEAANTQLTAENAELKTAAADSEPVIDYLKSQIKEQRVDTARLQADADKVRGADWASKMKWKVDMRYRMETIEGDTLPKRQRDRIRLRAGLEAKATDNLLVVAQLATGGTDPRSSNQTLSGQADRESIGVDLAYIEWNVAQGLKVTGGKMKNPLVRPADLFWDNDLNPEGLSFSFERGPWFGSANYFYLTERSGIATAGATFATKGSESTATVGQIGYRLPVGDVSTLTLAANYTDLGAGKGRCDLFGNTGNGNTTVALTAAPCSATNNASLAYDYKVSGLQAQYDTTLSGLPLSVFGEYAKNDGAKNGLDSAYAFGASLGKAANTNTWEVSYLYQSVDKDALFGMFTDSD
ncbi:MAG: hypothetical protein RJB26_1505, partial [Pseudomonadota bacterium]